MYTKYRLFILLITLYSNHNAFSMESNSPYEQAQQNNRKETTFSAENSNETSSRDEQTKLIIEQLLKNTTQVQQDLAKMKLTIQQQRPATRPQYDRFIQMMADVENDIIKLEEDMQRYMTHRFIRHHTVSLAIFILGLYFYMVATTFTK
jgi:predicted RND superfamily exporter protein